MITQVRAGETFTGAAPARIMPGDCTMVAEHSAPAPSVQDSIHFTYDDHQAATALQNVAGQPNRVVFLTTEFQ